MRWILTLFLLAALAFSPGSTRAFDLEGNLRSPHKEYSGDPELQTTQSDGMTLAQATDAVRRRTGGQVISAETKVQGGREVHYIKVLKDGKVKTHRVNGRRR